MHPSSVRLLPPPAFGSKRFFSGGSSSAALSTWELAAISADTRARRIDHREHHVLAAFMLVGAGFAKPSLASAIALHTDLGSELLLACLAHDLGRLVAGQQLHLSIRRPPLAQTDYFQSQFRRRAIVVLVGKLQPGLQNPIQARGHALLAILRFGKTGIAISAYAKATHVAATFQPDVAQKLIEFDERGCRRDGKVHPVGRGITPFHQQVEAGAGPRSEEHTSELQ